MLRNLTGIWGVLKKKTLFKHQSIACSSSVTSAISGCVVLRPTLALIVALNKCYHITNQTTPFYSALTLYYLSRYAYLLKLLFFCIDRTEMWLTVTKDHFSYCKWRFALYSTVFCVKEWGGFCACTSVDASVCFNSKRTRFWGAVWELSESNRYKCLLKKLFFFNYVPTHALCTILKMFVTQPSPGLRVGELDD